MTDSDAVLISHQHMIHRSDRVESRYYNYKLSTYADRFSW